jgi:hypothetical protein
MDMPYVEAPLHPLASTAGVKVTPHFAMLSMLLVVHNDITMDGCSFTPSWK